MELVVEIPSFFCDSPYCWWKPQGHVVKDEIVSVVRVVFD